MLCIPKSISEKLVTAIKGGDIKLEKLYDMSDEERRTLFSQYVGKESAPLVNTEFEKAMVTADKKAKADYVTASEKGSFAKQSAGGEFAKKLLSDQQKAKLAIANVDSKIERLQAQQVNITNRLAGAEGEAKLNLEAKLDKLKDQETQLNIKKDKLQNPSQDRMLKKIDSISKLLSPEEDKQFMNDLIKAKFGQDVTPEQGKYIVDQADKLQEMLKSDEGKNLSGVSPEYLNARNNLATFIDNLNPEHAGVSIVRNLIQIARNNLITNISTPLKTFISGMTNHNMGVLIRRIADRSLGGENYKLSQELAKENFNTFLKTGMNTAAMDSIDDNSSILGSHKYTKGSNVLAIADDATKNENFKEPSVGDKALGKVEKVVGKAAQISHTIAIQLEHNIPFTKIYGKAFADVLNFRAGDLAKIEGLRGPELKVRAEALMRDAARIEPQTPEGKLLRKTAQEGAARVLNVNNTWASRFSVGTKNALNAIVPGVPIGDLVVPIAKIPANIIANGINNTPLGVPEGVWDVVKGKVNMGSDSLETRYEGMIQYKNGIEHLIRIVGSVGLAALITSQLSPKDFRSDQYGNHFLNVGGTWINTEYFASLSPNLAGMMTAKADKHSDAGSVTSDYLKGSLSGLLNIPGAEEAQRTFASVAGGTEVKDFGKQAGSRLVPAAIQNLFKDRPINRLFFGANGVETDQQVKADTKAKTVKATATRKATAKVKAAAKLRAKL